MDIFCHNPEVAGTVLGKERCQSNSTNDYWLISFDEKYGDTLTYKGVLYEHVVKTNQLDNLLKKVGMRVVIGFDVRQKNKSPRSVRFQQAKLFYCEPCTCITKQS